MARIDRKIFLTDEEINALMGSCRHCRIATVGPGTDINLTPMTFGWANGKVYIFGRGQKVANLRRDPTATVLVDVGDSWSSLQGVMMRGSARVLEDRVAEEADANLEAAQVNLGAKHALGKPYQATAAGRSRRWIVFEPEKIVSWDHSKPDRSQRD